MLSEKQRLRFGDGHSFDRKIPAEVIHTIKRWETFMPKVYSDRGYLAQGYGHREAAGPPAVTVETEWTEPHAAEVLLNDLQNEFGRIINKHVTVPITNYMFGALCSLCYNCGVTGVLTRSKVFQHLADENYTDAALEFLTLNTSKHPDTGIREVLKGLTLRRCDELSLFMKKLP